MRVFNENYDRSLQNLKSTAGSLPINVSGKTFPKTESQLFISKVRKHRNGTMNYQPK